MAARRPGYPPRGAPRSPTHSPDNLAPPARPDFPAILRQILLPERSLWREANDPEAFPPSELPRMLRVCVLRAAKGRPEPAPARRRTKTRTRLTCGLCLWRLSRQVSMRLWPASLSLWRAPVRGLPLQTLALPPPALPPRIRRRPLLPPSFRRENLPEMEHRPPAWRRFPGRLSPALR